MVTIADAQRTFDQAAMDRLLAEDYVEVSPVGDVDPRAKVLSFYTPEARAPRAVTMCVTAQLRKQPAGWRIASVQYTPIPPPPK